MRYLLILILKGEGSQGSFDETSEEEKMEEQLDNDNINIEVIIVGDKTNYPVRQNHTIPIWRCEYITILYNDFWVLVARLFNYTSRLFCIDYGLI